MQHIGPLQLLPLPMHTYDSRHRTSPSITKPIVLFQYSVSAPPRQPRVETHIRPEVAVVKPHAYSFSLSLYPDDTFGQFIKKARLEKGSRQNGVAEEIGENEMTIVNWERYASRSTRLRRTLCEFLNVDYGDLGD